MIWSTWRNSYIHAGIEVRFPQEASPKMFLRSKENYRFMLLHTGPHVYSEFIFKSCILYQQFVSWKSECLSVSDRQTAFSAFDCVVCCWMISEASLAHIWQAYLIRILQTVQWSRDRCNLLGFLGLLSRLQLHFLPSQFFSSQISHALISLSNSAFPFEICEVLLIWWPCVYLWKITLTSVITYKDSAPILDTITLGKAG